MKSRRRFRYESLRQNLRREYCVELVKLRLLLEYAQLDAKLLVAQTLHLFLERFDIDESKKAMRCVLISTWFGRITMSPTGRFDMG